MEAADIAEQIQQALEEQNAERRAAERFRTRGAIVIAVQAMLLAISSLGGENATKEMVNANIQASDTWAFYQAKNIRQTSNQIAAEQLEATLMLHGGSLREDDRQRIQRLIERYRATVARYESEPDPKDPGNPLKGEGKRELRVRANHWESRRDRAAAQDPNFDYSSALFQIAIVLGSVSIIANSGGILGLSVILGAVALLLMLNGFFLFWPLPI